MTGERHSGTGDLPDHQGLRVVTVCFSRTLGGLELATLRRAAELREHGHHVLAVLPDSGPLVAKAEHLGIPVAIVEPVLPYADPAAALRLRRVFARADVALVARTRDLSTTMLAAGRHVAVVLYQQMQSGLDKRDWFHDRVYRRLDACVAITRHGRDELARCTALDPEKIAVIPYGVDTTRFSPASISAQEARDAFDLPDDGFVVGLVGGFTRAKGQLDLLEGLGIAAGLDPEFGGKLHVLLVGERPEDTSEYTRELGRVRESLPFAERVQFRPFTDDPRPAYRAMDLFVLASHSETFGMVVQEAMAMGTPVIGTDSGGVPEIIAGGETGLLVPPRDPAAIAAAVLRLYHDPQLRARLAGQARAFVERAYDAGRQYLAFERALVDAVRRRAGRRYHL